MGGRSPNAISPDISAPADKFFIFHVSAFTIVGGKSFRDDILKAHNYCRKEHSSPALKWSGKLAAEAQKAADEAAKTNTLKPVSLNNVGQNMAAMSGGELTGQRVTEMWYEEEKNYSYSSPGFSSSTGKEYSIYSREPKYLFLVSFYRQFIFSSSLCATIYPNQYSHVCPLSVYS